MKGKVANREGTLREHKDALESYCKNCKSLLGLDFVPTDSGSTILQMTAIDPDDKEKTFECELSTTAKEGEKQFTGEQIYVSSDEVIISLATAKPWLAVIGSTC